MAEILERRPPWYGVTALTVALGLLALLRFITTPEGQHWLDDQLRPLGYGVLLVAALWPLLFYGLGFFVLALTISAARRREPFHLGELALAIFLSLYLQIGNRDPNLWSGYALHLLLAGAFVLAASWGVRSLAHLVRRPA